MTTLKFTIVGLYEAEEPYIVDGIEATDPVAMAAIDQDEVDSGSIGIEDVVSWANARDVTVRIEPS